MSGLPERLTRLYLTNLTVHHTYSPISPGPSYADLQRGRKLTVHLADLRYIGEPSSDDTATPDTRLPFHHILKHLAAIIHSLSIERSHVGHLQAGELEGFIVLTELRFVECGIETLHPRTFYPLARSNRWSWLPSDLLQPGTRSVLQSLDLQRNRLSKFDWEILRPIAGSLEVHCKLKTTLYGRVFTGML